MDLTFVAPTRPLSVNKGNQTHWAARKRLLDPWKEAAWATARKYSMSWIARDIPTVYGSFTIRE